jgi:hypothetical protein
MHSLAAGQLIVRYLDNLQRRDEVARPARSRRQQPREWLPRKVSAQSRGRDRTGRVEACTDTLLGSVSCAPEDAQPRGQGVSRALLNRT